MGVSVNLSESAHSGTSHAAAAAATTAACDISVEFLTATRESSVENSLQVKLVQGNGRWEILRRPIGLGHHYMHHLALTEALLFAAVHTQILNGMMLNVLACVR